MRNLTGWAAGWAVALLLAAVGGMSPVSAAQGVEISTQATPKQGGLPAPKGRLKFKSAGPVCMCGEGMSEKDIEQALARSQPDKSTDSGVGGGQTGEKNLNLGVAK